MTSSFSARSLGLASVLAAVLATGACAACPIERARYRMIHEPDITAGFKRAGEGGGLAFFVHSASKDHVSSDGERRFPPQITYWFRFTPSSGRQILLSPFKVATATGKPTDPSEPGGMMDRMRFMAADESLRFATGIPTTHSTAPAYVLMPDLAEALHEADRREDAPTDFFRFSGCTGSRSR